ncbi:beta-galactosidase, partial [Klebsiella pneumoniae]|uniref:beta-galactosidase n=1 Tax=Klebsiella pneumoniae TaxID=573 RepID=UPI002FF0D677
FQWRKSRGSVEKFHGAVVDHVGHIDTRIGREVCQLGVSSERASPADAMSVLLSDQQGLRIRLQRLKNMLLIRRV